MKKPTSSAPHIWRKVSRNTCPSTAPPGRIYASITSQEVRMAVPAMKGVKEKATEVTLWLMEEMALTWTLPREIFGNGDQGPVHSTTTTIRIRNGSKAARTECREVVVPLPAALSTLWSSSLSSILVTLSLLWSS